MCTKESTRAGEIRIATDEVREDRSRSRQIGRKSWLAEQLRGVGGQRERMHRLVREAEEAEEAERPGRTKKKRVGEEEGEREETTEQNRVGKKLACFFQQSSISSKASK